jgi:hypothetical protein
MSTTDALETIFYVRDLFSLNKSKNNNNNKQTKNKNKEQQDKGNVHRTQPPDTPK